MNRMTCEANFCDIHLCDPAESTCGSSCKRKRLWDRLKAYEDMGLTPEEVLAPIHRQEEFPCAST